MRPRIPRCGRGVLRLYEAFRAARESPQDLAETLSDDAGARRAAPVAFPERRGQRPLQQHLNYFPELEDGAEALRARRDLDSDSLFAGLVRVSEAHARASRSASSSTSACSRRLRRYDPERKVLSLSEVLRRGSRNFQLAYQVGLLTQGARPRSHRRAIRC